MSRKVPAKTKAAAPSATTPAATPAPATVVACRLGPASKVGALMVGNARIEARKTGTIPRAEFERLQAGYDLVEVKE